MKNRSVRLIPRIALFSALIYVISYGAAFIPNVNPIFLIIFSTGFMWGASSGFATGIIGMGLWTFFNPYGPAQLPVMMAQMIGAGLSGLVGANYYPLYKKTKNKIFIITSVVIASIICTLLYFIPVNLIDAWLIQPFWPRFVTGMGWSLVSLISNIIIFPLLFLALESFYIKERKKLC